VLRYSFGDQASHSSITAMAYAAGWNATDQIPQRAVDQGLVGRFGAIDPSDGGQTSRYSVSFNTERTYESGVLRVYAYAIESKLDLYSDFTYDLNHATPLHADQFEQAEHRRVFGLGASRSFNTKIADTDSTTTVGVQVRSTRSCRSECACRASRRRVRTTLTFTL
jgi:hypothetical protein